MWLVGIGLAAVVWIGLGARTSRSDGTVVKNVHPYRRMLLLVSPSKSESTFQASMEVPADELENFLSERQDVSLTNVVVAALMRVLDEVPQMNRFVAGGRLYQRNALSISFSAKRQKGSASAKVSVVNISNPEPHSLMEVAHRTTSLLRRERSGEQTYADKEYSFFGKVPHSIMKKAPTVLMTLDSFGLLPRSFIENDPLFCSVFIANLGSIQMAAGHHHLFEWGNCPVFITVGQIGWTPIGSKDGVASVRCLPLRITYDERIDDGLTARKGLRLLEELIANPSALLDEKKEESIHA